MESVKRKDYLKVEFLENFVHEAHYLVLLLQCVMGGLSLDRDCGFASPSSFIMLLQG